jgi:AcrR family transcriptional regulator
MTAEGLRERKKVATRAAIGIAAWRLAVERGPDHMRIEDIAEEAGVSRRTFHNYFTTKEEAMASVALDRAERICAALRKRPAEEPLADALAELFIEEYASRYRPDEAQRAVIRRAGSNPGLAGAIGQAMLATEAPLAEAIAERTGADADRDLYPKLAAAAAVGALRATLEFWLSASDRPPRLRDILGPAIAQTVPPAPTQDPQPRVLGRPGSDAACTS